MRGSLSRFLLVAGALLALAVASPRARQSTPAGDLSFLQPWFRVTEQERARLTRREVVVRALPASDRQIMMLAATPITISPDEFLARIARAWSPEGKLVTSGQFSSVAAAGDVGQLSLDQRDLDRLRQCRAGDCPIKLGADEIAAVRGAFMSPGAAMAVQQILRNAMVDRARRYQQGGLTAVPDYSDQRAPVRPAAVFADILKQSAYLHDYLPPAVATYLEQSPSTQVAPDMSFLGWSKVIMNGKDVLRVSQVSAFRTPRTAKIPAVIVAGKQIYASRYMNGALSLTMLFAETAAGAPNYLVHVHQSELDELGGALGGLKRALIEGRIKQEATTALSGMRDRLEEVDGSR